MSAVVKRILGEAESPVEQHLSTYGAGAPPPGREYPSLNPPKLSHSDEREEKREVQIGQEMLYLLNDLERYLPAVGSHPQTHRITQLAQELVRMHGARS